MSTVVTSTATTADDGDVEKSSSGDASSPEKSSSTKADGDDEKISGDASSPAKSTSTNLTPKKRSKPGPKLGTKLSNFKKSKDWNRICQIWVDNDVNGKYKGELTQKEFLVSEASGDLFGNGKPGSRSEESSFSQKLKKFKNNELHNNDRLRNKGVKFPKTERMLVQYMAEFRSIKAENSIDNNDGEGGGNKEEERIPWSILAAKGLEFAQVCGEENNGFSASPGWIKNVLDRNGFSRSKIEIYENSYNDLGRSIIPPVGVDNNDATTATISVTAATGIQQHDGTTTTNTIDSVVNDSLQQQLPLIEQHQQQIKRLEDLLDQRDTQLQKKDRRIRQLERHLVTNDIGVPETEESV